MEKEESPRVLMAGSEAAKFIQSMIDDGWSIKFMLNEIDIAKEMLLGQKVSGSYFLKDMDREEIKKKSEAVIKHRDAEAFRKAVEFLTK